MNTFKSILKTFILLPAVTITCLSATIAQAGSSNVLFEMVNIQETNIYVNAKDNNYLGIAKDKHPSGIIPFRVHIHAQTSPIDDWRLNSWRTGISLRKDGHGFYPVLHSDNHAENGVYGESYTHKPVRKRPRFVRKYIDLTISAAKLDTFAAGVCNAHANHLRQQGLSNHDIFKQNRTVKIGYVPALDSSIVSSKSINHLAVAANPVAEKDINVVCMKAPPAPKPKRVSVSNVTDALLSVTEQSTRTGTCKLHLSSIIITKKPNTKVKYQFEDSHGNKSGIKTVTTDQTKIAMDAHWFDVPFNPNGAETGQVRIVSVSDHFESDWESYNMTCVKPLPNSLSIEKPTVQLNLLPTNNVMRQGLICPTKVKVTATLSSDKPFSGTGLVSLGNTTNQLTPHDVNLSPNNISHYTELLDLKPWDNINPASGMGGGNNAFKQEEQDHNIGSLPASAPAPLPSQRFDISYKLTTKNHKTVVKTPNKSIVISCVKPQFNPNLLPDNPNLKKDTSQSRQIKPKNMQLKQQLPQKQKLKPTMQYQRALPAGNANK